VSGGTSTFWSQTQLTTFLITRGFNLDGEDDDVAGTASSLSELKTAVHHSTPSRREYTTQQTSNDQSLQQTAATCRSKSNGKLDNELTL